VSDEAERLKNLKSLETLCRLNEQQLIFINQRESERIVREQIEAARLEGVFTKLFTKLDDVRNEIDDRVEKCSKKMLEDIAKAYVTKPELEKMTSRILARITWISGLFAIGVILLKFVIPGVTV